MTRLMGTKDCAVLITSFLWPCYNLP